MVARTRSITMNRGGFEEDIDGPRLEPARRRRGGRRRGHDEIEAKPSMTVVLGDISVVRPGACLLAGTIISH